MTIFLVQQCASHNEHADRLLCAFGDGVVRLACFDVICWVVTAMLVDTPPSRASGKGFLALRHVRHTFRKVLCEHRLNIGSCFSFPIGPRSVLVADTVSTPSTQFEEE